MAYVAGPDLVFEFASDRYRQALGGRGVIGLPFREALPEVVGQPPFEALRQVLRTGEPHQAHGEEVWLRRHGTELEQAYIDSAYQPLRDEAGRVAGVLISITDVSDHVRDRQQLEQLANNLQRSEQRYRTLFQTLPHGIIHYDRDGSVIGVNPAAEEILGLPSDHTVADRARHTLHEDGTPYRPDELPGMVALRTGEVVPGMVAGARNERTGDVRWARITAVPDARDAQGRPQHAYAVFTDITDQHTAQARLRQSTRLLGRLREANVLGVVTADEERIQQANDAFLDIIGYTRQDLEAGRITWEAITPPEGAHIFDEAVEEMRRAGACQPHDKELLHRDGHRVPALIGSALLDRHPLRWTTFIVDLSARQRGERARAELLAREQAARAAVDAVEDRLALLLLDAGNLAAATGNQQELRDQAAKLVVPTLADSCVTLLLTDQGMLRAATVIHRDPAKAAILQDLRAIGIPPDGPLLQAALTQASTQLVTDVAAIMPGGTRAAREVTDILNRAGLKSAVVQPLLTGQRVAGVAVLGRDDGRPRFTGIHVAIINELVRRLRIGMANADAFAREHTVAETLQHALLPEAPPQIAGLDLAVRYLPATDGVHVGGDWYDVFPLGRDRVALAIGDVAGHSISSASIMGQIRSILRAYTLDHPAPADVLRRTNAAVCQLLPDAIATVFYAVLDLSTGDLAYANAGHPPALLDNGDGDSGYLDSAPGAMLGATPETDYTAGHRRLAPGARLLLYTDGLIEDRRRDITEGFSALARAIRGSRTQTAEHVCQCAQTAMLGSGTRADDVCILAIHRPDQPALRCPGAAAPASLEGPGTPDGTTPGRFARLRRRLPGPWAG
jgi:PAS domain S-box-containing protein